MNIVISESAKEIFEYRNIKAITIYGVEPAGC